MAHRRKMTEQEICSLERERDVYKRTYDEIRKDPGDFPVRGCGDSSCLIESPLSRGGQHTNGGCRCELHTMRRAMVYWKRRAKFLEETIKEQRDAEQAAYDRGWADRNLA